MRKSRIAGAVFGAAAAVALVAGPVSADTGTSGDGSVLSGNQVLVPVSIPVNACGNAVSVLGIAAATGTMCDSHSGNAL